MEKKRILYVDACPRKESRTRRVADALVNTLEGNVERLVLAEEDLPVMDDETLKVRTEDCQNGSFDAPMYRYARQFAGADIIVIAAPFWDLSFPACLKQYIEAVSVTGITFRYSGQGVPIGLCRGEKLYYVTTSGGPVFQDEFGYGYLKAMAQGMYGIPETERLSVENLDIWGNDAEEIVNKAIESLKK